MSRQTLIAAPKGCEIAVLHGDPSQANADIFFKVPENFAIPHHWHTSAERIVLVSGKLAHKAFCAEGAPCVLFIAFESPVDAVAGTPTKQ